MELKEYQQRVLDTFDVFLEELNEQYARSAQIEELSRKNPELNLELPDFPAKTWAAFEEPQGQGSSRGSRRQAL